MSATVSEKLIQLNTNLGTINTEVGSQTDLIAQIKNVLEGNIIEGGGSCSGSGSSTGNIVSGTVTSDSNGIVTIPYPMFIPKQITLWNIAQIDQWEETGDDSLVRYLYNGVMLCAIRLDDGTWVSQCMMEQSGIYVITEASATRGNYQGGSPEYATTNIRVNNNNIYWCLGLSSAEDTVTDFTGVSFNYVLTG